MSEETRISKTQRKREMLALQELGVELVALNDEQLAGIELPENLRDAVLEARRITDFEGRRRQMQYIGKLMRKLDAAPIRERLTMRRSQSRLKSKQFQRAEAWRERLLAEESALAELLHAHPAANGRQLRKLIRGARSERQLGQPPRSYRALFQALRAILPRHDFK